MPAALCYRHMYVGIKVQAWLGELDWYSGAMAAQQASSDLMRDNYPPTLCTGGGGGGGGVTRAAFSQTEVCVFIQNAHTWRDCSWHGLLRSTASC